MAHPPMTLGTRPTNTLTGKGATIKNDWKKIMKKYHYDIIAGVAVAWIVLQYLDRLNAGHWIQYWIGG
jgi:hypothetical protein